MKKLNYLKPLLNFFIIGLIITTLSRLVLFFIFNERVTLIEDYWRIFTIGFRFDVIMLCYLAVLPAALLTFLPTKVLSKLNWFFNGYFILFLFLFLFMELATLDFINQYDTRPNRLFLDYLIYPKEVIGMLVKSFLPSLIITGLFLGFALFFAFKYGKRVFYTQPAHYKTKLLFFPILAFVIFL